MTLPGICYQAYLGVSWTEKELCNMQENEVIGKGKKKTVARRIGNNVCAWGASLCIPERLASS